MSDRGLAIVGGGSAGLAAAVAATQRGMRVELFEQSKSLGGRAGSFFDPKPASGSTTARTSRWAAAPTFSTSAAARASTIASERSDTLHFIGPDGTQHDFAPSRWLPAPLHLLPGLMRLKFLSTGERWGIVRALRKLVRMSEGETDDDSSSADRPHPSPLRAPTEGWSGEGTMGEWLRRQGQSQRAIERFWSVVLVSRARRNGGPCFAGRGANGFSQRVFGLARHERLVAAAAAAPRDISRSRGQVARRPRRPVHWARRSDKSRAIGRRVAYTSCWPMARAQDVRRRNRCRAVASTCGRCLPKMLLAAMPALADVERIEPAAITAVHLWFDRPITAAAPRHFGRPAGPMGVHRAIVVQASRLHAAVQARRPHHNTRQCHCQVVISASHRLPARKHDELLAEVRRELEAVWPEVRRRERCSMPG